MNSLRVFAFLVAVQGTTSFLSPTRCVRTLDTASRYPYLEHGKILSIIEMSASEESDSEPPPTPLPSKPAAAASTNNITPPRGIVDPMPPVQMMRTPPSPPPKRLDPLLASLTRVDRQAMANTPTTKVPILGEVTMDKSLFIVLPVVAFAILGFVATALVAFNSRDDFVQSITVWNDSVMNPTPKVFDPNECRGLCSSQEQDLVGLSNFMNGLGKK